MKDSAGNKNMVSVNKNVYKGYQIKRGPFGWFAMPIKATENSNLEERYGNSTNMDSRLAVECWIDEKQK